MVQDQDQNLEVGDSFRTLSMFSFPQPISRLLSFWLKKNDDNLGEMKDNKGSILMCNQSAIVPLQTDLFFLSNLIIPNVGEVIKNLQDRFLH